MLHCTYVDWQTRGWGSIDVSAAQVTDSAAFKNSKNIWTRHAGCAHTYTDTHTQTHTDSREAVVELRTQQGWLPEGVSRRWAEIRLCDCDCMSERICTAQQFSILYTHTCVHTHTKQHLNIYPQTFIYAACITCSSVPKTGSLDNTWPGCMTEFLVYYRIYQAYSILAGKGRMIKHKLHLNTQVRFESMASWQLTCTCALHFHEGNEWIKPKYPALRKSK